MWRTTCVLRKPRSRWLSRQLADLPSPALRRGRSWNDVGALTPSERVEVLHGSWRSATPVRLVRVTSERDGDAAANDNSPLAARHSNNNNNADDAASAGADNEAEAAARDVVTFASDEEAIAFVQHEEAEAARSAHVPTLQAAHAFYADLASTAEEEVDVDARAAHAGDDATAHTVTTATTTAAQRRDEERDVHRHFWADYYEQQGLVSADMRYAFVDAMLRPCVALFRVHGEKVLQRLTLRAQLEAHVAAAAAATTTSAHTRAVWCASSVDPLLYAIPCMPTQSLHDPPRVPYTAAQSYIAQREVTAAAAELTATTTTSSTSLASEHSDVVALPSSAGNDASNDGDSNTTTTTTTEAEALQYMLQGDEDEDGDMHAASQAVTTALAPAAIACCRDDDVAAVATTTTTTTLSPLLHARAHFAPPNIAQLQWLQRQMATDALCSVNELSVLLSVVAVRAALPYVRERNNNKGTADDNDDDDNSDDKAKVIVDLYGTYNSCPAAHAVSSTALGSSDDNGSNNSRRRRRQQSCSYYRDIAQYIHTLQCSDSRSGDGDNAGGDNDDTHRLVVVVTLPPAPRARHTTTAAATQPPGQQQDNNNNNTHNVTDMAAADDDEDDVDVPLLTDCTPQMLYVRPRRDRQARSGGGDDVGRGKALLCGACDVVVCTPPTSEDGVRPRVLLRSSSSSSSSIDDDSEANAPANRFVAISAALSCHGGHHLRQLCARLRRALRCARDGGWVLYATQSLNPLENEAVVCAVLTQMSREQTQQRQQQRPGEEDNEVAVVDDDGGNRSGDTRGRRREVECVSLHSAAWQARLSPEERCVLHACCLAGSAGLPTWVLVEGAPSYMDVDECDAALRHAVAAAAWRTRPLQHGSDGAFFIALRVRDSVTTRSVATTTTTAATSSSQQQQQLQHDKERAQAGLSSVCAVQCLPHLSHDGSGTRVESSCPLYLATQLPSRRRRECVLLRASTLHVLTRLLTTTRSSSDSDSGGSPLDWDVVQCGVPVGCYDAAHTLHLSTAACGMSCTVMSAAPALVAAAATRAVDAATHTSSPLSVPLSLAMLCELLRLRRVRAHDVRRHLHHLHKQRKQQQQEQQEHVDKVANDARIVASPSRAEDELRAFLRSMYTHAVRPMLQQQQHSNNNKSTSLSAAMLHAHIVLTPHVSLSDKEASHDGPRLHPAVAAELSALHLVASLTVYTSPHAGNVKSNQSRRSSSRCERSDGDDDDMDGDNSGSQRVDYVVSLDTPHAMPAHARHTAALAEVCVGLRDALLYVQRRLGDVLPCSTHLLDVVDSDALSSTTTAAAAAVTPVTLHDDEYTTIATATTTTTTTPRQPPHQRQSHSADEVAVPLDAHNRALVSSHEQRTVNDRLRRLRTRLHRSGVDVDGNVRPGDWARDVRHRRLWRYTTR